MKCPECGTWTIVKETRMLQQNIRKRRYECANMHRFSTAERLVDTKTRIRPIKKAAEIGGKP